MYWGSVRIAGVLENDVNGIVSAVNPSCSGVIAVVCQLPEIESQAGPPRGISVPLLLVAHTTVVALGRIDSPAFAPNADARESRATRSSSLSIEADGLNFRPAVYMVGPTMVHSSHHSH